MATSLPVGASANIVVVGVSERAGNPVSFWDFTRRGAVVTAGVVRNNLSGGSYCVGVRAEDLDEKFPVVNIDSAALDAVRLLAEHRLNGLVVVTDTAETPYAVLPASQVVRFIVPVYVQEDPGVARVLTESMADHAAERLSDKTIRDVLPKQRQHIPVANAHDTIIEVAEVMARLRSPLVAVVKDNKLHGVITASRLLAAALKH